jgi:hypothetical protein
VRDEEIPRHRKKVGRKPYGIEQWNEHRQKWMYRQWYATPKARDQALVALKKATSILTRYGPTPQFRKIDR